MDPTDANPITTCRSTAASPADDAADAVSSALTLDMMIKTSSPKPSDASMQRRAASPVYADISRPQSATQDEEQAPNSGATTAPSLALPEEDTDPNASQEEESKISPPRPPFVNGAPGVGLVVADKEDDADAEDVGASTPRVAPFRSTPQSPPYRPFTARGRNAAALAVSSSSVANSEASSPQRARSVPASSRRPVPRVTGATATVPGQQSNNWPSLRSQITSPRTPLSVGIGQTDPSGKKYVSTAADPTGSLSPGARFGYWRAKPFILNNVGDVKDYRTARQVVLDAEVAMNKTILMERLRAKKTVASSHRAQRQLEECLDEERSWRDAILQEKEMAYEAMERGMMDAEDMRMRLHSNLVFQAEAEARVGFFKMQADQYRQQFVEREQHLTDLRRQLREALESESAARNATQSMAKQLGSDRSHSMTTHAELRKELERRGLELVEVQQMLERLKQQHTTVTVEKDRAVRLMEQLTGRLKTLQGTETRGVQNRASLVQRAEVLQTAAETQVAKARDLARLTVKSSQSALSSLQSDYERCKQDLDVAQDKVKRLSSDLTTSNSARTKAHRELSATKREVAALRKELDAARLDAEAMREHLGMSKAEAGKLRAESERLRVEAERLRNSRSVDVDSLTGAVSGLTSEAARHQAEAVAALKAVAEAKSTIRRSTAIPAPAPVSSPTPHQLHTDILASIAQFQGALVAGTSAQTDQDVATMGPPKPAGAPTAPKLKKTSRRNSTNVDYDPLTGRLVSNRPVRRARRRKSAAPARGGGVGNSGGVRLPASFPSTGSLMPTPPTVEPGDTLVKVNNDDSSLAPCLMVLTTNGWKHPSKLVVGDILFNASPDGSAYEQTVVESLSTCFAGPYTMHPGMLNVKYVVSHVDPALVMLDGTPSASSPSRKKTPTAGGSKLRRKASKPKIPHVTAGETTPLEAGAPPAGKAYLVRPPEGLCGVGINATPVQPPAVYTDATGRFQVAWTCCKDKGLACSSFIPSHHSNKTLIAIDCPIIALINM